MSRLTFSARFALILTVLGALIAGVTVALPLAQAGSQERQDALDRVADRASTIIDLVRAEEGSLAGFATSAARQATGGGPLPAFLARLSGSTEPTDLVAAVTPGGLLVAQSGRPMPSGSMAWLGGAITSGGDVVADDHGAPWMVERAMLGGGAGTVAMARPLTAALLNRLTTISTSSDSGVVVLRGDTVALDGRVAGVPLSAGSGVPVSIAAAVDGTGTSSIAHVDSGDIAAAAPSFGGGYRVLVTLGVSGTSLLGVTASVIAIVAALLLLGLYAVYVLVQRDLQRPLRRLDRAVAALGNEDFSVVVPDEGSDELRRLGASFGAMRSELAIVLHGAEARGDIATMLTTISPLGSALDAAVHRLREATGSRAALVLITRDDGTPQSLHCDGIDGVPPAPRRLLGEEGPVAVAAHQHGIGTVHACPLAGTPEHEAGLREVLAAPLRVGADSVGVVAIADPPIGSARHLHDLLIVVAEQIALAVERDRVLEGARRQANTDGLTGLYNRRFLTDYLETQLAVSDRSRTPLSLLILDVDHFKAINDTLGHEVGDSALVAVAATLTGTLRRSDLAARLGGDEFVVVMGETSLEDAAAVAEKVRAAVSRLPLDGRGRGRAGAPMTVSIGVAARPPRGVGVDRLLTLADDALYEAKRAGRDRVCIATDDPPAGAKRRRGAAAGAD